MLTNILELLDAHGIPAMRGNKVSKFTTQLIIIDDYVDDARNIIAGSSHCAEVLSIGEGISIIKPA